MNAAISHNGLFVGGIGFVVDDVAEETLCPLEAENFAEDPQVDNRPLYESVREKNTCVLLKASGTAMVIAAISF